MRLFVAIDLPEEVLDALEEFSKSLRKVAALQWSGRESFHITTKFIGEWSDSGLGELERTLRSLPARPPIAIAVRGLGFFPKDRQPRILWAGVEAGPELAALARDTDAEASVLGVTTEPRSYSPHITLARIKDNPPLEGLREAIRVAGPREFGSFTATSFALYRSRPGPAGSVYTKLSEYPFHS
ncbi:MAG: RNA 2',3'-cyclic phosphodiesterase [Bryobacteraceae bacterium]